MPRLSDTQVPSYRLHKQSGQAVVTLSGRDVLLGKHNTRESREKYNRVIAEWLAAGRQLPAEQHEITVAEIIVAYRKFARGYYKGADGQPSGEVYRIDRELSPLVKLYARTPAAEFGPLKLKAVRDSMVQAQWCRKSVNHATGTLKRCFRWAAENELIPSSVFHGLQAVTGLRVGRCEAKESEPVKPVPAEYVEAVLPFVSSQVGAMIRLQLLTGARPGELDEQTLHGRDETKTVVC